jgi:diguanylate cyclase (GGDEF)-like protein/PAS domain S-box-containing protein
MSTISSAVGPAGIHAVFEALPDAVLTSDLDGRVDFLNRAAERLAGRTPETAVGQPIEEVFPLGREEDASPLKNLVSTCLRTGTALGPFGARLLVGFNNSGREVDVSVAPIRHADGPVTGAILIARDVTQARQLARQLSHQATHDSLTGLVNRAEFERRLTQALVSAAEGGAEHTLGFVDLDGFKRINDAYGHLAGDELLRQIGASLRQCMRARDTVARLGGDEFGLLLEHCTPTRAAGIAEHIRQAIGEHRFTSGNKSYSIAASIGLVTVGDGSAGVAELLRAADRACYVAKREGGNRVQLCVFSSNPYRSTVADTRATSEQGRSSLPSTSSPAAVGFTCSCDRQSW